MHESEVNRIKRELRQLVFGIKDMRLAREAAESLIAGTSAPERVVETGMVVTYCRAFSSDNKRRQPITEILLSDEESERAFHEELRKLRDTLYAHSDETPNRVLVDPFGEHDYTEGYRPWKPDSLVRFANLTRVQEKRFDEARQQRQSTLREAGVPADPAIDW